MPDEARDAWHAFQNAALGALAALGRGRGLTA